MLIGAAIRGEIHRTNRFARDVLMLTSLCSLPNVTAGHGVATALGVLGATGVAAGIAWTAA